MTKLHFWYSATQKARINYHRQRQLKDPRKLQAVIDGKLVEYTTWSRKKYHGTSYDDIKYLGKGEIKR